MTTDDLIAHVAEHAGVTKARADRALRAVLSAVGGYLGEGRRDEIADELPLELRSALLAPADTALPLAQRVLEPGERLFQANELIASSCLVLADVLSTEALDWLWLALPAQLSRLFVPPAHEAARPHR